MTIIPFSSSSPLEPELPQLDRLMASMASRFARLHVTGLRPAVTQTLEELVRLTAVESAVLVAVHDGGGMFTAIDGWPRREPSDPSQAPLPPAARPATLGP